MGRVGLLGGHHPAPVQWAGARGRAVVLQHLRAADDLLAADEDVKRARVVGVVGARHGVKGAHGERVAVQHVEIGAPALLGRGARMVGWSAAGWRAWRCRGSPPLFAP